MTLSETTLGGYRMCPTHFPKAINTDKLRGDSILARPDSKKIDPTLIVGRRGATV